MIPSSINSQFHQSRSHNSNSPSTFPIAFSSISRNNIPISQFPSYYLFPHTQPPGASHSASKTPPIYLSTAGQKTSCRVPRAASRRRISFAFGCKCRCVDVAAYFLLSSASCVFIEEIMVVLLFCCRVERALNFDVELLID